MTFLICDPLIGSLGWMEEPLQAAPWWVWLFLIVFLLFLGIGLWMRSRGQGLVKPEKNLMSAAMEPKSRPRAMPALLPEKPASEHSEAGPIKQDELAIIFGIGPQIANLLRQAGVDSFAKLAATSPERILEIMRAASPGTIIDPVAWPVQARLAAEARWGELQEYQQSLRDKN
jgi:predicted flap endonuclease-1-like 5' DNA nuclease